MLVVAFVQDPGSARRILDHLHLDGSVPPLKPARGPPSFVQAPLVLFDPGPELDDDGLPVFRSE